MIKRKTCENIWRCYREIETGEKLLKEVDVILASRSERNDNDKNSLMDAFGREQNLQLMIPSGNDAHRLLDLSYELARPVIQAHITNKQTSLKELQIIAELELNENTGGLE